MEATDTNGSLEFVMTWKRKRMPSGAPICRLAARARRTGETGCSSWPTPKTTEHQTAHKRGNLTLNGAAQLSIWPTPDTGERGSYSDEDRLLALVAASKLPGKGKRQLNLQDAAQLAAWATPRATDIGRQRTDEAIAKAKQKGGSSSLEDDVQLVHWATPAGRDYRHPNSKSYAERGGGKKGEQLPNQVAHLLASGPPSISSPAATEKRGVLNPEHPRWLQGYPAAWGCCGATAMQSCRKSPRRSSGRSLKAKAG
jgi:hypothetical protein